MIGRARAYRADPRFVPTLCRAFLRMSAAFLSRLVFFTGASMPGRKAFCSLYAMVVRVTTMAMIIPNMSRISLLDNFIAITIYQRRCQRRYRPKWVKICSSTRNHVQNRTEGTFYSYTIRFSCAGYFHRSRKINGEVDLISC